MLSHDLHDPLDTIAIAAELMHFAAREGRADEATAARIATSASRMRGLIDDMLDVTRPRMGNGLPVSPVDADIREIVCDTVDELAGGDPGRCVECVPAEGDFVAAGIPRGGPRRSPTSLPMPPRRGSDLIRVSVGDEAAEVRADVVTRARSGPTSAAGCSGPFETRHPTAGVGLGLLIATEIARAPGGSLLVLDGIPAETHSRLRLPRQSSVEEAGDADGSG